MMSGSPSKWLILWRILLMNLVKSSYSNPTNQARSGCTSSLENSNGWMWNMARICNHINARWKSQILRTQIVVNLTILLFKNTTIILSNKIKKEQLLREVQEGNWTFKIQKNIKVSLALDNLTSGWTPIRSGSSMAGFTKLMETLSTTSFSTRLIKWIFWLDHTQFTNKKLTDCNKQVWQLFLTYKINKTSITLVQARITWINFTAVEVLMSLLTKKYVIISSKSTLIIYSKQFLHFMTSMTSRIIRFTFMIHVVCRESQLSSSATWPYS